MFKISAISLMLIYAILCGFAGFWGEGSLKSLFNFLCLALAGFALFRQSFIMFFAFLAFQKKHQSPKYNTELKKRRIDLRHQEYPEITAIVPAYNEGLVIANTINSLLNIDYPNLKILVIDDGSADDTFSVATKIGAKHENVQVISQANGGKSKALNTGIRIADSPFVLCVDADSQIKAKDLKRTVDLFQDPRLCAVAGYVEVGGKSPNLLQRLQHIEYMLIQKVFREALSWFKAIPIVPGPIGLFRRQELINAGCYTISENCFAEDAELSIRLLSEGKKIVADNELIAVTQAPEDLNKLLRQRYRWIRGSIQAVAENLPVYLKLSSIRGLGIFFFLLLEYILLPIAAFTLAVYFLFSTLAAGEFSIFVGGVILLVTLELITLLVVTEKKQNILLQLYYYVLYRLFYAFLLIFWAFYCFVDEIGNSSMSWDKLDRYQE